MNRHRVATWLAAGLVAIAGQAVAQTPDDGPLTPGECVGPHVDHVIVGDYQHGMPDRFVGPTPTVLAEPGSDKVGQLEPGGSYTVAALQRGYALLRATRYSKPALAPGTTVGWVRASELHFLMLRNCI